LVLLVDAAFVLEEVGPEFGVSFSETDFGRDRVSPGRDGENEVTTWLIDAPGVALPDPPGKDMRLGSDILDDITEAAILPLSLCVVVTASVPANGAADGMGVRSAAIAETIAEPSVGSAGFPSIIQPPAVLAGQGGGEHDGVYVASATPEGVMVFHCVSRFE
jgi:hypothetical protein